MIPPSHNPARDGGFKYNPPNGGPAETEVTDWIGAKANEFLESGPSGVKRVPFEKALRAATTHHHDFLDAYTRDLGDVIDIDAIGGAKIKLGVDPLGGAGVHYWTRIAEHYRLDLTVVDKTVDPTFAFMTVDWDGQIRMDPSSPCAMQRLIGLKDRFEIAFACDTDHDRHGIVTREELEQSLRGYGWTPYFVEGHEPALMHEAMAATLDTVVEQIKKIQEDARVHGNLARPRWPMIVLISPKGWTGLLHKMDAYRGRQLSCQSAR